jgi:hypothetical protein
MTISRQLVLNLSQVKSNHKDVKVKIGKFDFDDDKLKKLRGSHFETHVFRREGDTILCIPYKSNAPNIGGYFEDISLGSPYLRAALIRNSLLNYLYKIGREVKDYLPITFLADNQLNFLVSSLPSNLVCPDWLAVRPLYEADIRVVNFDGYPPFVTLALNVQTSWIINQTCDKFLAEEFSLEGLYVGRYISNHDYRVRPLLQTVGRISKINGNTLFLDDSRDDLSEINADEAVLIRDSATIERCLNHAFGRQAESIQDKLRQKLADFRNGKKKLQTLKQALNHFQSLKLEMIPGVNFTINPFISEPKAFPTVQLADKPTYIFDPAGRKNDVWHDRGLRKFGPYDSQNFTPTTPKVCVICQSSNKGQVEQFLYKLKNGIAESKTFSSSDKNKQKQEKSSPFAQGLVGKYKLDNIEFEFILTDGKSAESYLRAAREALTKASNQGIKWDLALVQIDESHHKLFGDNNPYFVTKAKFLSQQIPVQEFEIETAMLPDNQLGYVLNNMALATYAKLGGVPWLMKANPTIAHEVIFGLGSASIGQGRLSRKERIVGITTVFTGDGRYYLSNLSQAVPMEDYEKTLLSSLKSTIEKIKQDLNWQKRDHVRLVFHSFKPFKDIEADAVKKAVEDLSDYDVDLAFLHIAESHPYMIFDEKQGGVFDYKSKKTKGVYTPQRGYFLRMSASEILMATTGPSDIKQADHGMPRPILLKLHRNSTFTDTTYLSRQVFSFTCHSWRSFFPSPMPVTILYSDLIANLLGNLDKVSSWDVDVMLGRIGRTRWFL